MRDFEPIFYRMEKKQRRQSTSKLKAHSSRYFSSLKIKNVMPQKAIAMATNKTILWVSLNKEQDSHLKIIFANAYWVELNLSDSISDF